MKRWGVIWCLGRVKEEEKMLRRGWLMIGRALALGVAALAFQASAAAGSLSAEFTCSGEFYGYRDTDTGVVWAAPGTFNQKTVRHDSMEMVKGSMAWVGVAEPLASTHRGGGFVDWRLPTMAEWTSFNRNISWCSDVCTLVYPPQQLPSTLASEPYWTSEVSSAMAAAAWPQTSKDALKMWYSRGGTSTKVWPVRGSAQAICPAN